MQVHGGNVYAASRELSLPIPSILDFSASINPLGMAPGAVQAIKDGIKLLAHYPDPDCHELKMALSDSLQVDPACLCLGNGSTELIYLLPLALNLRRALVLGPTFSGYARAVAVAGGKSAVLLADPEDGFRIRVSQAKQSLTHSFDAVFVCNPNNPTGQGLTKQEILELWEAARHVGVPLIVDEAFIEYCESDSVVREAATRAGLLVLRSFTKFYGMPGLRVGYLVAEPGMIRRIQAAQAPWSMNTLAQYAAAASLGDHDYAKRSRILISVERPRLVAMLKTLGGFEPQPSCANFLFVRLPAPLMSTDLAAATRRQGVLIRDCASFERLDQRWIRVAVRTAPDSARLFNVLKEALVHVEHSL